MSTSAEPKKRKTAKDKLRGAVEQSVSVLDRPKSEDDQATVHTIETEGVRKGLKRNRDYGDIALELIQPDPEQVRRVDTTSESFEELVASVREHGVLEPITVRWMPDEQHFQIITGERRYQAAKRAGLKTLPAVRKDVDDTNKAIHQLVENLQRENMNPVDEAKAFRRYLAATKSTQNDLAKKIGKSKTYVSVVMGLLEKLNRDEQEELAKVSPAKLPGKSLILEALRADDQQLRLQILRGEFTRQEARSLVKKTKPAGIEGKPKKFTRRFDKLQKSEATVAVTFPKPRASDDEILTALQDAVKQQKKLMRG